MSFGAAGLALAIALLVLIILTRKDLGALNETVDGNVEKTAALEKMFGTKVREAVEQASRTKNPILKDYDELRTKVSELSDSLRLCQNELKQTRTERDNANNDIAQLNGELSDTKQKLTDTGNKLSTRENELNDERNTTAALRTEIAGYKKLIGENILEMAPDQGLNEIAADDRTVLLSLAKMSAMREAEVDSRNILREFQSFDNQLNAIIPDQAALQSTREAVKSFVEPLLDNKYHISWPRIGSSISEYNQNDELDLDESESGTTIKIVKCATIRFADAEGAVFQKAKVICD